MPCDRCGSRGHSDNGCRTPNDPTLVNPNLWSTFGLSLVARRLRESQWHQHQIFMQAQFTQNYWRQPIIVHPLAPVPIPHTTSTIAAPITHDEEAAFVPKLALRKADKAVIPYPQSHLYHVVRPGFSTKAGGGEVLTNHFPVTLPGRIWVYDISGFPSPITRQRKKVLVQTMFNCAAFLDPRGTPLPPTKYVYDGNERIVAWIDLFALPTATGIVVDPTTSLRQINIPNVPSARSLNGGNELRIMTVRERVQGGIDLHSFTDTINGNALTLPSDTSDDITSLNAIISRAASEWKPNNNFETFAIGTNKFFLRRAYTDLGGVQGVLHAHTGFFSTLKPAMGQTVLNLNIATSAFYRPIRVSDYLDRILHHPEIGSRDQRGLRGIRVYINYERGHPPAGTPLVSLPINQPNARVRTICGIGNSTVNTTTFTDDNNVTTGIVAYLNAAYRHRAGFPIQRGDLRAINLGTPTAPEWYCPEHLQIMPYQPWTGLVPSTHSADMIDAACLVPGEVKAAIMERGREALGITSAIGNNAILTGSGLLIGDQMMRVPMRQIPAPALNYRGDTVAPHSNDGQWNLNRRIFDTKCDLYRLHFVANTLAVNAFNLSTLGSPLYTALTGYLGHTPPPMVIGRLTHTINVPLTSALLTPLLGASHIPNRRQMVVWIHPNGDKAQYVNFRTLLDRELGYPSLCITHAKILKNWGNLGGLAANNAMKINVRVGSMGVNHHVDLAPSLPTFPSNYQPLLQHTMIIGADVTHPGGGAAVGTGSIAALVGTIDSRCQVYRGVARPNPSKTEIISAFDSMLGYLLSKWKANNKDPGNQDMPRHILYFRDGVSDSQYDAVRTSEVNKIHQVYNLKFPGAKVSITAVVCTKRHHTRFYNEFSLPPGARGKPVNQNTKPGTCVDSGITNPVYFDFYLQSHKAIKGTARPAHYFVLQDDNNFTAEQLQDFVHKLCFTYARSSTSVSYATPAYYADRLCGRIRNYFSGYLSNTRTPRTVLVPPELTQSDATYNDFVRDWNAPGRVMSNGNPADDGRGNPWHTELDDTTFWI